VHLFLKFRFFRVSSIASFPRTAHTGTVYFLLIAYVYREINQMQLFADPCFSIGDRGVLKGNYSSKILRFEPGIRFVTDPGMDEEGNGDSWRRPVYSALFLNRIVHNAPFLWLKEV